MGLSYTGSRCLFVTRVSGLRRLPVPPASTTPFIPVPRSADQFARPTDFQHAWIIALRELCRKFQPKQRLLPKGPVTASRSGRDPPAALYPDSARAIFDRYFIDKSSELQ